MSVKNEKDSFKADFSLYRRLFSRAEKRRLILFLLFQSSLAFLDLLGVLLFGLLGSMLLFGTPNQASYSMKLLSYVYLDELNFRQQILILSFTILLVLVGRTVITSFLTRKLNLFLANKNAKLSAELLRRILYAERSQVESISQQEFLMGIVRGTHSFLIRQVASFFGLFVDTVLLVVLFGGLFILEPLVSTLSLIIFTLLALGIFRVTHGRVGRLATSELKFSVKVNERVLDVLNSSRIIKVNGDSEFFVKSLESEKLSQANALAELAYLPIFNKYASEVGLVLAGFGFGAVVFTFFENAKISVGYEHVSDGIFYGPF
jgi:ABC-type multidrug transport system fused ATPase/permease subunit